MAICPIICSFYYLARALMHDVAGEIACAEGCAETISANVLKSVALKVYRTHFASLKHVDDFPVYQGLMMPLNQQAAIQGTVYL